MGFILLIYRLRPTRQRATGALKLMWVAANLITGVKVETIVPFRLKVFLDPQLAERDRVLKADLRKCVFIWQSSGGIKSQCRCYAAQFSACISQV